MHANWTPQQEALLRDLVESKKQTTTNWSLIAQKLNRASEGKNRNGKQCREKYINRVKYAGTNKSAWTDEEFMRLLQYYEDNGSRWVLIQRLMPDRSENSLKNKFYGELRKLIRRVNQLGRDNIPDFIKEIKYESIVRILQGNEGMLDFKGGLKNECFRLKVKIMDLLHDKLTAEETIEFIHKVHRFNMITRCYCAKKTSKKTSIHYAHPSRSTEGEDQCEVSGLSLNEVKVQEEQQPASPCKNLKGLQEMERQSRQQKKGRGSNQYEMMEDLDEEVSNILGKPYLPLGFSYFENT